MPHRRAVGRELQGPGGGWQGGPHTLEGPRIELSVAPDPGIELSVAPALASERRALVWAAPVAAPHLPAPREFVRDVSHAIFGDRRTREQRGWAVPYRDTHEGDTRVGGGYY